ncbi:MAG TPA: glycoside hydrolase family 3 N-terminal domain-containing protein, partial [Polyangia bacterium]|nr:glycoside hydrolase family 3 N-terminal domain-containing protein [Polyangia bacterium]
MSGRLLVLSSLVAALGGAAFGPGCVERRRHLEPASTGGMGGMGGGTGGMPAACTDDPPYGLGPGLGGAGNEVVISGSAGAGVAGTGGAGGAGGGAAKTACAAATADPLPYTRGYTANPTVRDDAQRLAASMSDAEKQQQMSGLPQSGTGNFNVFQQEDNTDRGVRGFKFRDGPRGVNLNANGDGKHDYSTSFPVAMARGAAFDDDLEFHIGQAVGDEMLASGNTMMLAPTINILRHPAWGRAQETYGEEPFLLGRLGSAFVAGVQRYVGACPKHYAANNIENGRQSANATMDEQTLREIYARHFEMVVKEGGASSVMAAYNLVNGTKSTQNKHLLTDVLRDDFGFQGFVLSDWWAMPNGANLATMPSVLEATAIEAVHAGLDMELPWRYNYSTLTTAVADGALMSSDLTTGAARILEQKMRFHVESLNDTLGCRAGFTTYDTANAEIKKNDEVDPAIGKSHLDVAEIAALESIVLLKNQGNTLPINRANVRKIAVVGAKVTYSVQSSQDQSGCSNNCSLDFSTNVRTGDLGSSRVFHDPAKARGPFDGIKEVAGAGITVTQANTAAAAADADFIVVVAGLTPEDEGEEYTGAGDRTVRAPGAPTSTVNLGLDPKRNGGVQSALITSVIALNKPMVVVLEGGSIVTMPWLANVPAVVMAWYPGQLGGRALAKLLFGDANNWGKLPLSWAASESELPEFANFSGTTRMDYAIGYRWYDQNPTKQLLRTAATARPMGFGYGLSYSTFNYSNLQVPCATVPQDGVVNVTVDVTNTSARAGDEIVFLFVSYGHTTSPRRPLKELKAYKRVSLAGRNPADPDA